MQLSEQNLIDCVIDCGCGGCSLLLAYEYAQNNGIQTADQYPYTAKDQTCRYDGSNAIKITGFEWIPEGDEDKLKEAISTIGPISIEMDASHDSFIHYSSGIYFEPECSSHRFDHGVLAVGYGTTENGEDYYIMKNWWGEKWGENGYFKLARNRDNHCGIATRAVYPTL